jgi:hypothetical protein
MLALVVVGGEGNPGIPNNNRKQQQHSSLELPLLLTAKLLAWQQETWLADELEPAAPCTSL